MASERRDAWNPDQYGKFREQRTAPFLFRHGFSRKRVRLEIYAHPLGAREDVVEWARGTTLTDYEKRLDPPAFERFLSRYRERLMAVLPDERPFLFTFRRLFLWARR